jgi:hypothetical protein
LADYPAFDANLTEAAEAVVGSGATFRFELADNLNFPHLAKIESITDCAGIEGWQTSWSMNPKFRGPIALREKPKFHHAPQIGAPDTRKRRNRSRRVTALAFV